MSKKSSSQMDAERRAEARRRARLQAQGRLSEEEQDEEVTPERRPSTSIFERLFPPAAQLPGKSDPLAGFTYAGRFRLLVSSLWLLPRNPLAGVVMGILWTAAYILVDQYPGTIIGSIASFVSFGALVAAGWIGWQRPWLFGLAAAAIGYLLYAPYFLYAVATRAPAGSQAPTASQIAVVLVTNGVLQIAIGALAGFYGGYLRRRLADPAMRRAPATRRRR
jgi:hypothetical protein